MKRVRLMCAFEQHHARGIRFFNINFFKKMSISLGMVLIITSCAVVKEYEKIELNDPDMTLSERKIDRNISTFHAYREAASGANGGKTGGGCGCN